jgi:hypothetical protein
MNLREIRPWAQTWFALELVTALAVMLAGLLVCPFLWGWYGTTGLLIGLAMSLVGAVVVFGFLTWVGYDARRSAKQVHSEHLKERPDPTGDLTDVASAPVMPPWMGTGTQ